MAVVEFRARFDPFTGMSAECPINDYYLQVESPSGAWQDWSSSNSDNFAIDT